MKYLKKCRDFIYDHVSDGIGTCFIFGFLINLYIETLARKGWGGFEFLFESPLVFLCNSLIIAATLTVTCLFKHHKFFFSVLSVLWLAIGTINGVILMERMTPFTVKDLASATDAATILTNYFNTTQLIGIAFLVSIAVILVVVLWIISSNDHRKIHLPKTLAKVAGSIAATFVVVYALISVGALETFFGNLAYAYQDYGVPYCFVNTWLNTGIHKPSGYSETTVKSLLPESVTDDNGNYLLTEVDVDEDHPNILFLQLESFTDPELFNNIELSEDAIPYFRSLMENYSSGYLTVPACGAGTANTEFEVMTGLSVKFFGPGEYPFKSILRKEPAESIAWDLKSMGYSTSAIHNHRALFYNRNEVFANIGYDTFTSVEYMSDVAKTPKNWAKDQILVEQIMKSLTATEARDYIYTISVQGHGKYPTEQLISNPDITVTSAPDTETRWKYEYYVNQIYEMDQFVENLTTELMNYDEPVILVMYGDHIPALDVTEDSYDLDLYQTPYVIWTNYSTVKVDQNLHTYELAAEVFDRLGIHTGTTINYHQNTDHSSEDYLDGLKMLGYDMLYGEQYIYGGENPFTATNIQMGVSPVKITSVVNIGGKYYIKGENFTEYSKVTLNGQTLSTIYLGSTLLGLEEEVNPEDAENMKVSQIDKSNKEIISTTE